MNDSFMQELFSMVSRMNNKKVNDALDKAIEILKTHEVKDIANAIQQSKDISQIINLLPESKKSALLEKLNSQELQNLLNTDKTKAIEILQQIITENTKK